MHKFSVVVWTYELRLGVRRVQKGGREAGRLSLYPKEKPGLDMPSSTSVQSPIVRMISRLSPVSLMRTNRAW